jgi:hypothetical protein
VVLVFDNFSLLWFIKFSPFGIKHRKGRHDKHRKQLNTCHIKELLPLKESSPLSKSIPPCMKEDILPPVGDPLLKKNQKDLGSSHTTPERVKNEVLHVCKSYTKTRPDITSPPICLDSRAQNT